MPTWLFWITGPVMITMFISWLIFRRLTMGRIERQIKADGLPRPCPWDGPGARIMWYAYAIALPVGRLNRVDDPFINVPLVRSYATRGDAVRGWMLIISGMLFGVIATVSWFVLDGDV